MIFKNYGLGPSNFAKITHPLLSGFEYRYSINYMVYTYTTFPLVPYNLKGREGDAIQYDTCCSCSFLRSFSGLVPMNLKLRFYKEKIKEEEEKGKEEEKGRERGREVIMT